MTRIFGTNGTGPRFQASRLAPPCNGLQRGYVFGLGTFLTLAYHHGHFLPFVLRTATSAVYGAEMHKNILAFLTFNESKSLFIVKPLDYTFD